MKFVFLFLIYFTLCDRLGSSTLTDIFGISRNTPDESVCRAGIEMQMGRTDVGTPWGKERVGWMGMLGLIYTVPSCPTLCDPMDCSPPGSFVHGILQARILE